MKYYIFAAGLAGNVGKSFPVSLTFFTTSKPSMAGSSSPRVFLVLLYLISLAFSYPVPANVFDVIVIGGGPAGLSATSGLARVRRNVLMLDSGEYRNAATRHMHDVIGNDGKCTLYVSRSV
jgi:hypothetical protein